MEAFKKEAEPLGGKAAQIHASVFRIQERVCETPFRHPSGLSGCPDSFVDCVLLLRYQVSVLLKIYLYSLLYEKNV